MKSRINSRSGRRVVAATSLFALLLLPSAAPAAAQGKPQFVDVIVHYDSHPGNSEQARARGLGGQVKREFQHLPMLALRVPVQALKGLAAGNGIRTVSLDLPVEGLSAAAKATANLPSPDSPGYTDPAWDVAVAVLDSGASSAHWDLNVQKRVDIISPYLGGGSVRDEFNGAFFDNNDGTTDFQTGWVEFGESNGPSSGSIRITSNSGCVGSLCLAVRALGDSSIAVAREVNLAGVQSAELTFHFDLRGYDGLIELRASSDGGVHWTALHTFDFLDGDRSGTLDFDLAPYVSDETQIGFFVVGGDKAELRIDDLEIEIDGGPGNDLDDPFGHGTHVAGIVTGSGASSGGLYGGFAPGAPIISLRVLDHQGRGVVSDVLAGLDWVLANASTDHIRVVNMSLGKGIVESAGTDPLVAAVEAVWDAGIVVVCSAGNYGRGGNFTITSPGNSPKVITVGSITDNGTGDPADDYVSSYSSQGPTLIDHYLKPDLIAPGNRVVAAISSGALKKDLPERNVGCSGDWCPGGIYLELSGTSMAAAEVSATAALMISQDPTLGPATVKARLMRSARKISGDPTAVGAGVLDVAAALAETGFATLAPSPKMNISSTAPVVLVEDTALTWNDPQWAAGYLWSDGYLWADGFLWADGYMWADGYLWADAVEDADPLFDPSSQTVTIDDD